MRIDGGPGAWPWQHRALWPLEKGDCRPRLNPGRARGGVSSSVRSKQQHPHWTPGSHLDSALLPPGCVPPPPGCSWVRASVGPSSEHVSTEWRCKRSGQNKCSSDSGRGWVGVGRLGPASPSRCLAEGCPAWPQAAGRWGSCRKGCRTSPAPFPLPPSSAGALGSLPRHTFSGRIVPWFIFDLHCKPGSL